MIDGTVHGGIKETCLSQMATALILEWQKADFENAERFPCRAQTGVFVLVLSPPPRSQGNSLFLET